MSITVQPPVRVVLVTVPDRDTGLSMARTLVQEQLAACGNLVPGLTSIYRWKGQVHEDPECLLLLKCAAAGVEALTARVRSLHPYECPEILCLPVAEGSTPYVEWVLGQ